MKDVSKQMKSLVFACTALALLVTASRVSRSEMKGRNLEHHETSAVFGGDGMIGYACAEDTGCLAVNHCDGFGVGCEQGWEDVPVSGDFYMCTEEPTKKCTTDDVDDCITRIGCQFDEDSCVIATPLVVVGGVQSFDDCATGL
jgi:hypothetical protein